jgi:hypothetical protein
MPTQYVHRCEVFSHSNSFITNMKSIRFFTLVAIILSASNILQAGYFGWTVIENYQELLLANLVVTAFINVTAIFFAITLIFALTRDDKSLIAIWLIFSLVELTRSAVAIHFSWKISTEFERAFNVSDLVFQVLLFTIAFTLLLALTPPAKTEIPTVSRTVSEMTMLNTSSSS